MDEAVATRRALSGVERCVEMTVSGDDAWIAVNSFSEPPYTVLFTHEEWW